jgi:hypothetical protein
MSNRSINYTCQLLHGTDKQGLLKQDANGYYECALGAFDVYNSAGQYYPMLESIAEMFAPGGALRRRLDRGFCRGEYDHPKPVPGRPVMEFIRRVVTIDPDRVSHHIRDVSLTETKDHEGKRIVLTTGWVKPSGPFGPTLKESLDNPEENTAFSIRSLTDDKFQNGRIEKRINTIVTWDYVNEPGIHVANKFQTPTLEDLEEPFEIFEDHLRAVAEAPAEEVSMESKETATMVLTELGWQKVQRIIPSTRYLKW